MTPSNRSRQEKPGAQPLSSSDFVRNPGLKISGLPAPVGYGDKLSGADSAPGACAAAGSTQDAAATSTAAEKPRRLTTSSLKAPSALLRRWRRRTGPAVRPA